MRSRGAVWLALLVLTLAGCCAYPHYRDVVSILETRPPTEQAVSQRLGIEPGKRGLLLLTPKQAEDASRTSYFDRAYLVRFGVGVPDDWPSEREGDERFGRVARAFKIEVVNERLCDLWSEAVWGGPRPILVFFSREGRTLGWLDLTPWKEAERARRHGEPTHP